MSSSTRSMYSSWSTAPTHGADALLDVRVEAGPTEALVAVELALGARADREGAQQQVERLPDRVGVGVGTEVADALALGAPHHHRPWPLLVEGDRQVRVGLVVLQPDVEAGPVLLDEVELEEQRLDLVADRDPLDRVGGVHHLRGALRQAGREVRHHPAAQALRLAHVEHAAVGVLELVRPRRVGDRGGDRPLHSPIVAPGARPGELAGSGSAEGRRARVDGMLDRAGLEYRHTYRFRGRQPRGGRPGCPRRPRAEPHTPRGTRHAETAGSAAGPLHPRVGRRARRAGSPRPRPSWANGSLILGHHYQRDEVIKWADARGDSFKLARFAADNDQATDIVFCGVHFMAESADVLTGDHQRVILPDLNAGCSMADMADIDQVEECWDALADVTDVSQVVPITYMNSSAALKAFVGEHGGAVCTSSNARADPRLGAGQGLEGPLLPRPAPRAQHRLRHGLRRRATCGCGTRASSSAGSRSATSRRRRCCSGRATARCTSASDPSTSRRSARSTRDGEVIVHPECAHDVVELADRVGSTERILDWVEQAPAGFGARRSAPRSTWCSAWPTSTPT